MLTPHQKIVESLKELGHTSGWVVYGTEIEWIVEPQVRPTQKQIDAKVLEIESILEAKAQETELARQAKLDSAITKLKALGLTEAEAKVVIGIE
jgi:hypothetical protein